MTDIKERAQNAMHRAGSDELALLLRDCIERIEELEAALKSLHQEVAKMVVDLLNANQRIEELETQNIVIPALLSLLDQIAIEDDASLAEGRFQILEDIGFDVVWTGKASGEVQ